MKWGECCKSSENIIRNWEWDMAPKREAEKHKAWRKKIRACLRGDEVDLGPLVIKFGLLPQSWGESPVSHSQTHAMLHVT